MSQIKATQIEIVPVEKLVDHPRNNNVHSGEQIARLAKILAHQGFREPLTVSRRSGFIVCGHARKSAAIKAGFTELPVCYQDFESEAEEYQHLTAENEIARWATLDVTSLVDNLHDLNLGESDLDFLGIDNFTLDVGEVDMPDLSSGDKSDIEQITFTLHESQAQEVRNAISNVLEKYKNAVTVNDLNENKNGNAIAYICELFNSNGC